MPIRHSSIRHPSILALAALTISAAAPLAGAADHHHPSHDAQVAAPPRPAKKWQTDEVVRRDMDNIRKAVLVHRASILKDSLGSPEYKQLAEVIDTNVADIVKNCKLTPEVDKAFHSVVLADLMHGSELMRTSATPDMQRTGALAVIQSLRNYGKYFDHRSWSMEAPPSR